jgi:hypothetical protein
LHSRALAGFSPARVLDALGRVRGQHIQIADQPLLATNELIARVRTVLAGCDTGAALSEAARKFTTAELKAAIYLVASDEQQVIRNRVIGVIRERTRKDLLPLSWRLLVERYSSQELETVARELIASFGIADICGDNAYQRSRMENWLRHGRLASGVALDFDASGAGDLDAWLEAGALRPSGALARAVWVDVLTGGSAAVWARMQTDLLVSRANSFPTEIQSGFAQRYLVELKARQHWNGLVCRWIRRQFGVPASGESHAPFWRRVPAPVRDEFRRWVQEQTLSEFFSAHGDTAGRFQFWRRFSSRWHDVYAAVDNRVMVMDFDEFGVIEFAEVGNAAYVYDAQSFSYILSRNPRSIAEFKNRSLVHERILHFEGWQYRADAILLPLLRRRPAAP